jgi:hypothetical protein
MKYPGISLVLLPDPGILCSGDISKYFETTIFIVKNYGIISNIIEIPFPRPRHDLFRGAWRDSRYRRRGNGFPGDTKCHR